MTSTRFLDFKISWYSRSFMSSRSTFLLSSCLPKMSAVSEQPNITFITSLGNLRWGSGTNAIQHKRLSRLGKTGEAEYASLIADSGNPLPHSSSAQMNSDSRAIYNCRPSSTPSALPRFFLCAGGTGGRLKGICDLIITPSPHPSDPAASISLSAPLSPALSHLVTSLLSPSFSIYLSSNLCLLGFSLYSVPHLDAL